MMNKKRSSKLQLSKYAFLLPIIIFSAGAFTVTKADDHIIEVVNIAKETEVYELGQVLQTDDNPQLLDTVEGLSVNQADTLSIVTSGTKEEVGRELSDQMDEVSIFSDTIGSTQRTIVLRNPHGIKKDPLIVVDGVRKPLGYDIKVLDPNNIESIEVLKDAAAITVFGQDAKNGVVKIHTKKMDGTAVFSLKGGQADTTKNGRIRSVVVKGRAAAAQTADGSSLRNVLHIDGKQPLIIVDGREKTDQDLQGIDPDAIESISVLKDAGAKAIYGDKGAHGVIHVTTKAGAGSAENKAKIVQGVPLAESVNKEVVVVGYGTKKNKSHGSDSFYSANDPESLKKFLEDNRANIDLKSDVVLVINGKVAREADLKNIKAADVSQVGAIDLTEKNSNLPKNMVGLLFLKDGNPSANRGASASVYNAKRKIELVVNPDKKVIPYIERK